MNVLCGLTARSSAAIVAAVTLCTLVSANEMSGMSAVRAAESANATVPMPKLRPASIRKRSVVASRGPRTIVRQQVPRFTLPYERIVVRWPLILGVGY